MSRGTGASVGGPAWRAVPAQRGLAKLLVAQRKQRGRSHSAQAEAADNPKCGTTLCLGSIRQRWLLELWRLHLAKPN